MSEEKTTEEKKPQDSTKDTDAGVQSETEKKIEQLNAKTERLNKALAANELAKAEAKIAGVTDAGVQPEPPKEETPKEYKDRVLEGKI